jgi:hypothetical protein
MDLELSTLPDLDLIDLDDLDLAAMDAEIAALSEALANDPDLIALMDGGGLALPHTL